MAQRRTLEDDVFEFIINQFGRRIVVTLYLIADYLYLLVDFRLRINRMENDVGEQIYGSCDVLLEDGGVINRAFLVGVGVQVASHALQTVENMPRLAALCALESNVLAEVGKSFFARLLVSGAGVNLVTAIHHLAV